MIQQISNLPSASPDVRPVCPPPLVRWHQGAVERVIEAPPVEPAPISLLVPGSPHPRGGLLGFFVVAAGVVLACVCMVLFLIFWDAPTTGKLVASRRVTK